MAYNRLGIKDAATTTDNWTVETELFEKLFQTEIIKAFREKNIMSMLHRSRNIRKGKAAVFPTTWKTNAQYFIPGVTPALAGTNKVARNEVTIFVDRLLESDQLIYHLDELMDYADVRGEYAEQMGEALATRFDLYTIQLAVKAARLATARVVGAPTGPFSQTLAADPPTADDLVNKLVDGIADMATRDVPLGAELSILLKPAQYFTLVKDGKLISNLDTGGQGSIASGNTGPLAGSKIMWTNNLPSTDMTVGSGADKPTDNEVSGVNNGGATGYWDDFTKTRGLILHRTAISTVKLMDINFEQEYMIEHQGHLQVAKMAVGHGITRAEGALEVLAP